MIADCNRDADSHGFMFTAPDHDIPGGIQLFSHLYWGFSVWNWNNKHPALRKARRAGIVQVMTFWQQQSH